MSAFGKRGGISGGRPNFGVAKPMKGGAGSGSAAPSGGDQFPPLEELDSPIETPAPAEPSAPLSTKKNSTPALPTDPSGAT